MYDYKGIVELLIIGGLTAYVVRHPNYQHAVKKAYAIEAGVFGVFLAIALLASRMVSLNEGVISNVGFYFVVSTFAFLISARSGTKSTAGND